MSDESEGIGASGDIISALSDRVSELTKRVGSLESELDAARKPRRALRRTPGRSSDPRAR
ncbi:MAG: hypothetical protein E6J13_07835 [Chloroflexi bacterium]|nr:MAG: hypothetical protein E6J13_07835 [Chloroflexota bacterium]